MIWLKEVAWWKKDLAARTRTTPTSSDSTGGGGRWCVYSATTAAAVCIAGVVVLSAAWASLRNRWTTTSRPRKEQIDRDANLDTLVAYLRKLSSGPTTLRKPPPLLLGAAPESENALLVARVPPSMPALSLWGLVITGGFVPSIPLFVSVDSVSGGFSVLAAPPPAAEVATPPLLLCAEAKEESVALVPVAGSTSTVVAPLAPVPVPVLFLCSVLAEMASLYVPRLPAPMPVLPLSSLPNPDGLLSLGLPLVVGVSDGVVEELSIVVAPLAQPIGTTPLLLSDEGASGTGGVPTLEPISASFRAAEPTSSPAAATPPRARNGLWGLPGKGPQRFLSSTTREEPLNTPSTLRGASIKNPSRAANIRKASCPPSAPPHNKPSTEHATANRSTSPCDKSDSTKSGGQSLGTLGGSGNGVHIMPLRDGGGGGGGGSRTPATTTRATVSPLWSLPGQARSAAPAARGRSSVRCSAWALGKSRRGSTSPDFVRRPAPSRYEKEPGSGKGGGITNRGRRAAAAYVAEIEASATAAVASSVPRSILATGGSSAVNPRRAAAVARGVRWLDLVQREEEQARSRRERASRWMGNGGKKRDGPQRATPRESRARRFAEVGQEVATGVSFP